MELELNEIYSPDTISIDKLGYIAMVAKYKSKWVIVRLEGTNSWESPGGGIEPGETPLQAAKRELFEETGALESIFHLIGQYSIKSGDNITYGNLYFAKIIRIGPLPKFEIEEVKFVDDFPFDNTRHPKVIPQLFKFVENIIDSDEKYA